MRTREAHSQQLAETHVFSPFRESLYSTLPAAHLGRLRGGAGPAAAPVSAGIETPLRAAPARKKAKATPAAQDGDGADAESASPAPGTTKPPHALTIEAGTTDQESSAALMHPKKLAELGMMEGDLVRLKGKRDRETLCILQESDAVAADGIGLAAVTRDNLKMSLGDATKAYRCDDVKHGERVLIEPFSDATGGLELEEIHEQLLTPYFHGVHLHVVLHCAHHCPHALDGPYALEQGG